MEKMKFDVKLVKAKREETEEVEKDIRENFVSTFKLKAEDKANVRSISIRSEEELPIEVGTELIITLAPSDQKKLE